VFDLCSVSYIKIWIISPTPVLNICMNKTKYDAIGVRVAPCTFHSRYTLIRFFIYSCTVKCCCFWDLTHKQLWGLNTFVNVFSLSNYQPIRSMLIFSTFQIQIIAINNFCVIWYLSKSRFWTSYSSSFGYVCRLVSEIVVQKASKRSTNQTTSTIEHPPKPSSLWV
jgi:hypothetical protein